MRTERNGLTIGLTSVGIAAIADFEVDQTKMARHDFDASKLGRLAPFPLRDRLDRFRSMALPRLLQARGLGPTRPPRPTGGSILGGGLAKSHALGAADRGATGIAGLEC